MKLNAKQLRKGSSLKAKLAKRFMKRQEIYIILDNVLDTYNIGSIFRLSDAVAARRIYLCGDSETPPNHRIKKASVNTTEVVEWQYFENSVEAIKDIQKKVPGIQIVAVEQTDKSVPYNKFHYQLPIALIVGNETSGISPEALNLCSGVVELPMFGINVSLNVMVSLAIVLYYLINA